MAPTRYAIVGTGGRSQMFGEALLGTYAEQATLAALCDPNTTRMAYWNRMYQEKYGTDPIPAYAPPQFEPMLQEQRIDRVIVTSPDRIHHEYICRALEAGCDAVTEKPMTIDGPKTQQILETLQRTGRRLVVTFNYRYAPRNSKIKELLQQGVIGDVKSVHFEWLLDTRHGADYFRRWHRDKRNSGGLMVHKATHHFDLVNWWIGARPDTVFGMGDLVFYGRANAEKRGVTRFYDYGTDHPNAEGDPFALNLCKNEQMRSLYYEASAEDGYRRDQSVFGDGISIEDDMCVLVRYDTGATMTYHLTAYAPWEGYRVMFNGTKGRLEYEVQETSYVSTAADDPHRAPLHEDAEDHTVEEPVSILLRPHWSPVQKIELPSAGGGHGGGDPRLLADVFTGAAEDPLGRAAGPVDGALSVLTGAAANRSFETGAPVRLRELVSPALLEQA